VRYNKSMIQFERVCKRYDKSGNCLEDVSIHINEGEFVSIIGHSGAGKTTLIRLLLAEEKPTEGSVYFKDDDVHRLRRSDLLAARRNIGTVFQDFKLLPNKTAYENIAFAMEAAGKSDQEIASDVPHVLKLVDLEDRAYHFPHQLSGGEKQRLAIARAIINNPDVVVADEPTGNLDPDNANEVLDILKKINDLGTTVIVATHSDKLVDGIAKRVIVLKNGRVVNDTEHGKYVIE
jgi:cell division transport system ATP-binding protein